MVKNYSLSCVACSLIPDNCSLCQYWMSDISFHTPLAFHRIHNSKSKRSSPSRSTEMTRPFKTSTPITLCNTHTKMKWETILVSLLCLEVVICRNGSHVSRAGAHTGDCRFFLSLSVCKSGNVSSTNSIHVATLLLLSCRIASSASILKFRATATARTTGRPRCWSATTEKRPAKRSARVWVLSMQ